MRIVRYAKGGRFGYGCQRETHRRRPAGRQARRHPLLVDAPGRAGGAEQRAECIGLNYLRHCRGVGRRGTDHPVLFMKMPSSVQHLGGPFVLPRLLRGDDMDHECDLAVVIGRRYRNVSASRPLITCYTCGSARDWKMQWDSGQCRGQTFDTFCPLRPALVTADEIPDLNILRIRTVVNERDPAGTGIPAT